jgi:mxaC protein
MPSVAYERAWPLQSAHLAARSAQGFQMNDWLRVDHIAPLWLLPLALWPWFSRSRAALLNAWIAWAPRDRASQWLSWLLPLLAALAIVALVLAMAGAHRPEYAIERVGKGAEIVILLDRSRSMDQSFGINPLARPPGGKTTGPEALDYYASLSPSRQRDAKGKVARQLLSDFTAARPDDLFALIVFSTLPLQVMGFTQKDAAIQAAIAAGNVGRGLSETHIGLALQAAFEMFEGRPYKGSRIVMLVSDGGDRIEPEMREHLARLAQRQRVALYWLYLRSANSPGLQLQAGATEVDTSANASAAASNVPELLLHRFFESLPTPYRAYEAGDPEALKNAIADVNRLENLPITYQDVAPRRDLTPLCLAVALVAVLLLLGARCWEIKQWH